MTQKELVLKAFDDGGGVITLGYALRFPWGYTLRNRVSELKREGFAIMFYKGDRPSENYYVMLEKDEKGHVIMPI